MPRDAKLGLVIGVGLVLVIAVVFFRKEPPAGTTPIDQSAPAAVAPTEALPTGFSKPSRPTPTRPAVRSEEPPPPPASEPPPDEPPPPPPKE